MKNNNKTIGKILLILFILFSIYGIYRIIDKRNDLNSNTDYTTGKLIEVDHVNHGYNYKYEYTVNNVRYIGRSKYSFLLKGCNGFGNCIGRKFKVKYSSENPENSELLLDEEVKNSEELN